MCAQVREFLGFNPLVASDGLVAIISLIEESGVDTGFWKGGRKGRGGGRGVQLTVKY